MGTINYKTGKYLTLAVDDKTMEAMEEEFDYSWLNDFMETFTNLKDDYYFNFFEVSIEYGYYEGFCITVNDHDWLYLDDTEERKEVNQEIKKLEEFLSKCLENGLVVCHPGWCTGYCDEKQSKKELKEAMQKARAEVKKLSTYRTYARKRNLHS